MYHEPKYLSFDFVIIIYCRSGTVRLRYRKAYFAFWDQQPNGHQCNIPHIQTRTPQCLYIISSLACRKNFGRQEVGKYLTTIFWQLTHPSFHLSTFIVLLLVCGERANVNEIILSEIRSFFLCQELSLEVWTCQRGVYPSLRADLKYQLWQHLSIHRETTRCHLSAQRQQKQLLVLSLQNQPTSPGHRDLALKCVCFFFTGRFYWLVFSSSAGQQNVCLICISKE